MFLPASVNGSVTSQQRLRWHRRSAAGSHCSVLVTENHPGRRPEFGLSNESHRTQAASGLQNYGLHNQVHDPTFFRGVTRSVLDVVLMSGELCGGNTRPECAVQQCDFTSHHRRVVVTTAISRTRVKPTYRTGRNWRALNTEELIADVRCTDWTAVVRPDDSCELQWEHFSAEMSRILDVHAPVRRFRVYNSSPPPVSDDTLDLMCQRREAKNNGNIDTYNRLNVEVKRAIITEKKVDSAPPCNTLTRPPELIMYSSIRKSRVISEFFKYFGRIVLEFFHSSRWMLLESSS